jgi:hypothetical protein
MQLVDSHGIEGGGSGHHGLSSAVVGRLSSELVRHLRNPNEVAPELRAVIGAIAREARAKNLRAEQLVIIFKTIWSSLPPLAAAADRDAQESVKQHLVTLCIQAYYRR